MRSQLRLAERQGLLTGRLLSTPQHYALVLLTFLDEIEGFADDVRHLKWSLVAAGLNYKKLFPEYAEKEEAEEETTDNPEQAVEGAKWDYSEVEWRSGADNYAEFEQMMSELKSGPQVLSGDQFAEMPAEPEIKWTEWS